MSPALLHSLRERADSLRQRWETLLRIERVNGPLANPDALVHLIPSTLDQIFAELAKPVPTSASHQAARSFLPACDCGHNPYLAYFVAGEQAVTETVVLLQAEQSPARRRETDLASAMHVIRSIARAEIDTFCGICTHRTIAEKCRFAAPAR